MSANSPDSSENILKHKITLNKTLINFKINCIYFYFEQNMMSDLIDRSWLKTMHTNKWSSLYRWLFSCLNATKHISLIFRSFLTGFFFLLFCLTSFVFFHFSFIVNACEFWSQQYLRTDGKHTINLVIILFEEDLLS